MRLAVGAVVLIIGVLIGLGSARLFVAASPQEPANAEMTAEPAAATSTAYAAYRQTLANLAAAVQRHDNVSAARFRESLTRQATPAVVAAIYADRSRILANIAAAEQRHDTRILAELNAQLDALCPAVSVSASPSFCR